MRKKTLNMDEFTESLFSFNQYSKNSFGDKNRNREKMIKSLKNVIEGELTDRQKTCILMYYGNNMKMKSISETLGVSVPCVSRHIKKAKKRLTKTMKYYF